MDTGSQAMPRQQASEATLLARAMKKYRPGLAWQKWRAAHLGAVDWSVASTFLAVLLRGLSHLPNGKACLKSRMYVTA